MQLGRWQLDSLNGGDFWLDGGVVFGVVPKTLWSKLVTPDENNRIRIRSHCVLARDGERTVLIDAGYGGKFSPLDKRFHSMEDGNPIVQSLGELGLTPEQIDTVILTHLHFDHAGGLTVPSARQKLAPTFPRARHYIGRIEWEDATSGRPEFQTAYSLDNLTPLADADLIQFIAGDAEILPGVQMRHTGGHTRGHMAIAIESQGQSALVISDLCPTSHHLHPMWNLSYDTFPLDTRRVKPKLLAAAAERNAWVIWPHDVKVAAARLKQRPNGSLAVADSRQTL
jgi:glyoxylase-like metal-dependent hydrolase (beta-lactamase superfamily II)